MKNKIQWFFVWVSVLVTFSSCTHPEIKEDQRQPSSYGEFNIQWDRFIRDEKMPPFGKYAGQIVETERRRALILLTEEEKKSLDIPVEQLAFANFRHAQKFYIATLPGIQVNEKNEIVSTNNIVEKIILSEKHWAAQIRKETRSIEVHSELTFFLKDSQGVQLVLNQDTKTRLKENRELKEPLVFSIEAVKSKDFPQDDFFPAALGPNFALAHRIESNTERNMQHLDDPDRIIVSNKLDFSNTQSRLKNVTSPQDAVLVNSILKSYNSQRSQAYEVLTQNCTNGLFNILDQSLKYKNKIDDQKIKAAVLKFTRNDLKKVLIYLKQQKLQAEQTNVAVSESLDKTLVELSRFLESQAATAQIDSQFMLTFPAFIQGHLKARGLIK